MSRSISFFMMIVLLFTNNCSQNSDKKTFDPETATAFKISRTVTLNAFCVPGRQDGVLWCGGQITIEAGIRVPTCWQQYDHGVNWMDCKVMPVPIRLKMFEAK